MAIVGPRPPLPEEVAHYDERALRRLTVKPGVTCLWQISGRCELSFEQWMALDNAYIDYVDPARRFRDHRCRPFRPSSVAWALISVPSLTG